METRPTTPQLAAEARLLAAIAEIRDLPACAPVVLKALVCLENPDHALGELTRILTSDQAVAARILRLANSAYFGLRSEVRTVSQAVVLLGQSRIRTMLRRILADRLLSELGFGRSGEIRRRSLAAATACCLLAQLLAREDAEEALLAGLLHNVGELFFFSQFPAQYERAKSEQKVDTALGMSRWRAGRLLLENWRFPGVFLAAVEFCEAPLGEACPAQHRSMVWLVHAGKQLGEGFAGGRPPAEALERIAAPVREALCLDQDLAGEVAARLPERMSLEQLQAGRL